MNVYLASPYTHPSETEMEWRYYKAIDLTADLIERGWNVFSPIVHSHYISKQTGILDSRFWVDLDLSFLDRWADCLLVLCIPGYWQSDGVAREVDHARTIGLSIVYTSDRGEFVLMKKIHGRMWE